MTTTTDTTITTAEQAEQISHNDLRRETLAAIGRCETVRRVVAGEYNSQVTETIFFANDRVGQADGGDAVWGDAVDADSFRTDEGLLIGLGGAEIGR